MTSLLLTFLRTTENLFYVGSECVNDKELHVF